MLIETDILVAGAGPAGLAAACVFGAAGHRVTLVDPAAPITGEDDPGADLRTTALLQPARDLLGQAGVWDRLAPHAAELWTMRIIDAAQTPPVSRDFQARDISDAPFGWNFPNWLLRREMLATLNDLSTVTPRFGTGVTGLLCRDTEARVTLSDGTRIAAQLVVACDGKASPLRALAGIGHRTVRYGQTALVFAVAHRVPHDNVSTEIHKTGGPFTLVPLPDRAGQHRSAIVWMDSHAEQARRAALEETAFTAEMNARAVDVLGPLTLISGRASWPITSVVAERLADRRLCLAAEAAHGMPPIGAQGLNTSLKDIAALRDLCRPGEIGSAAMTRAYARRRTPDILLRMTGIDLLNRMSIAQNSLAQRARGLGVAAFHDIPPVRRGLMRLGLGTV